MSDKDYLKIAVEQARKSVEKGGFPAGAVVVKDEAIVSKGVSLGSQLCDPTGHAETVSIIKACQKLKTVDLVGATLFTLLWSLA